MELRAYISVLKRHWWLLLLGPLCAGLTGFVISRGMTPVYRASATLLVNQTQNPGALQYNDILTSERLTNTYAQLIQSRPVLDETVRRLSFTTSSDRLASQMSVSALANTQLLK